MTPVYVPSRHLIGVYVWIGNDCRGFVWLDRSGWRWTTRNVLGVPFRFGVCNSFDEALDRLI